MNKVIRGGMVAVLVSPGYGAGWYSWHGIQELLFDPVVVDMLENNIDRDEIEKYCEKTYGEDEYYGGVSDLTIAWIPEGREFMVHEYDGSESLRFKDEIRWIQA